MCNVKNSVYFSFESKILFNQRTLINEHSLPKLQGCNGMHFGSYVIACVTNAKMLKLIPVDVRGNKNEKTKAVAAKLVSLI